MKKILIVQIVASIVLIFMGLILMASSVKADELSSDIEHGEIVGAIKSLSII